jgi:hypothetical protein
MKNAMVVGHSETDPALPTKVGGTFEDVEISFSGLRL